MIFWTNAQFLRMFLLRLGTKGSFAGTKRKRSPRSMDSHTICARKSQFANCASHSHSLEL